MSRSPSPRGFSLIGMLVTLACVLVLGVMLLSSMNKAITGAGSVAPNSVWSFQDKLNLAAIMQGVLVYANEHDGRYPVPGEIAGDEDDQSRNTTANLFSAVISSQHVRPEHLVTRHEQSGYVQLHTTYDYNAYDPAAGIFWDPSFKADLADLSHTSFAHMPLYGERFDRRWRQTFDGTFPLVGSRGPRDGVITPSTFTVARDGQWAGHFAYGDGHVAFVDAMELAGLTVPGEQGPVADHVYKLETGDDGGDGILTFTRRVTDEGPEVQFD